MRLWIAWWNLVRDLQPAFARTRTFLWFALALAAMSSGPQNSDQWLS